jgi:hypothetical protein
MISEQNIKEEKKSLNKIQPLKNSIAAICEP